MDEISRELPPDTTTARPTAERSKGPEELIAFERAQISAELVVRDRLGDAMLPQSSMNPAEPEPEMAPAPEPTAVTPEPMAVTPEPMAVAIEPMAVAIEPAEAQAADGPAADGTAAVDSTPAALAEVELADAARIESAAPTEGAVSVDEPPVAETETAAAADAPADEVVETIDGDAAAAAVAAEAEVAEIEEDLGAADEEGLPPVPELTDAAAVARVVFVLMLTAREGLSLLRLAQACNTTQKLVEAGLELLQQQMQQLGLPVELARTGDTVKWVSSSETFVHLQRLRGVKKLEKLSPAALETLAVIAYRQPVMRGEIEAIRGVKAGPMLRTLLTHKLVRCTGRADVPGRPLQYGTTQQFLERFGLAALTDLPSVKEWKSLG